MDTVNKFMVERRNEQVFLACPACLLTEEEALNLAAWLAVVTDPEKVFELVEKIQDE